MMIILFQNWQVDCCQIYNGWIYQIVFIFALFQIVNCDGQFAFDIGLSTQIVEL